MKLETITRIPENQTHQTPLLFIHGMWHGAWCWDEFFLPFFAGHGFHVTALSLRGHAVRGDTVPLAAASDVMESVARIPVSTDN